MYGSGLSTLLNCKMFWFWELDFVDSWMLEIFNVVFISCYAKLAVPVDHDLVRNHDLVRRCNLNPS